MFLLYAESILERQPKKMLQNHFIQIPVPYDHVYGLIMQETFMAREEVLHPGIDIMQGFTAWNPVIDLVF